MKRAVFFYAMSAALITSLQLSAVAAEKQAEVKSVFAKDNLVAWCIVPFDANNRTPRQRAEMLERLGIKKLAYDWRDQHVATFEQEIIETKRRGIEFFAFWSWHPALEPLIEKYKITPQLWIMAPSPDLPSQVQKVEAACKAILPIVEIAKKHGCRVGLYNHGDWSGEPENLVAMTKWLRANAGAEHVGIVYNFHHGHGHIKDFAASLAAMQPYLLCLNVNGMNADANPLILPLGSGQYELEMMKIIQASGYNGPIGILDHREDIDAEKSLRENLAGMEKLLREMGDKQALKTY